MDVILQFDFMIFSTIVFFLAMCLYMGRSVPKDGRRRTLDILVCIAIVETLVEFFWFSCTTRFTGVIIATSSAILTQVIIVLDNKFFLTELKILPDKKRWISIYYILNIPFTILCIIEPFTGWMFIVEDNGTITGNWLRTIWACFVFAMLIFIVVCAVIQVRKGKKYNDKKLYRSSRTILETLIIMFISSVLQYVFLPDTFLATLSLTWGLVYLYIKINSEMLATSRAESAAIETELEAARDVQKSLVPSTFPVFPDRHEFELLAALFPTKAVGGDFYDYYMPDSNHLVVTVADVSGKGMPAALFMAMSKTQIKSCYAPGLSAGEILEKANDMISSDNNEKMFVTVWLAILDITTGIMDCANAGHEYPVIHRNGGSYELYKDKHGFVLGGVSGMKYTSYNIELAPGDSIFMYTDGIPEAEHKGSFLGCDGMIEKMNKIGDVEAQQLISELRSSIEDFADGEPQSDDIAMLYLKYKGA